ncbi:MAG TPA: GNAT family N-acetyltransferase [Caulobacteraceae bacterium]
MAVSIEALGAEHDRSGFECGQADLDAWFQRRAGQDARRNVARVFVALDGEIGVVGFYSLGAFTLALDELPPALAGKLPRYDAISAALIGRPARDLRVRGQGIGELLLADAIRRVLGVAQSLAVFAIVVDAKDDAAAGFYRAFGFTPFPSRPGRLFLPTSVAAAAMERL